MRGDLVQSSLVILDLDQFGSITKQIGWPEYAPNQVTGLLTELIQELLSKNHGTHIRGLDYQRGTEEAILFFSAPDLQQLITDLKSLKTKIYLLGKQLELPVTISIGVSFGKLPPIRLRDDSKLMKTLLFKMAQKALRMAKKQGGNHLVVY